MAIVSVFQEFPYNLKKSLDFLQFKLKTNLQTLFDTKIKYFPFCSHNLPQVNQIYPYSFNYQFI